MIPSVLRWNDKDDNCLLSARPDRWMAFRRKLTPPLMSGMGLGRVKTDVVRTAVTRPWGASSPMPSVSRWKAGFSLTAYVLIAAIRRPGPIMFMTRVRL